MGKASQINTTINYIIKYLVKTRQHFEYVIKYHWGGGEENKLKTNKITKNRAFHNCYVTTESEH